MYLIQATDQMCLYTRCISYAGIVIAIGDRRGIQQSMQVNWQLYHGCAEQTAK